MPSRLINLYKLLSNTSETEELCYNSIIILKNNDKKVAFAVDSVESVSEIDSNDIQMTDYANAKEVAGIIRIKQQNDQSNKYGSIIFYK